MRGKPSKVSWAESLALSAHTSEEEVLALAQPGARPPRPGRPVAPGPGGGGSGHAGGSGAGAGAANGGDAHSRKSSLAGLNLEGADLGTPTERLESATALAAYLAKSFGKVRV